MKLNGINQLFSCVNKRDTRTQRQFNLPNSLILTVMSNCFLCLKCRDSEKISTSYAKMKKVAFRVFSFIHEKKLFLFIFSCLVYKNLFMSSYCHKRECRKKYVINNILSYKTKKIHICIVTKQCKLRILYIY